MQSDDVHFLSFISTRCEKGTERLIKIRQIDLGCLAMELIAFLDDEGSIYDSLWIGSEGR